MTHLKQLLGFFNAALRIFQKLIISCCHHCDSVFGIESGGADDWAGRKAASAVWLIVSFPSTENKSWWFSAFCYDRPLYSAPKCCSAAHVFGGFGVFAVVINIQMFRWSWTSAELWRKGLINACQSRSSWSSSLYEVSVTVFLVVTRRIVFYF